MANASEAGTSQDDAEMPHSSNLTEAVQAKVKEISAPPAKKSRSLVAERKELAQSMQSTNTEAHEFYKNMNAMMPLFKAILKRWHDSLPPAACETARKRSRQAEEQSSEESGSDTD